MDYIKENESGIAAGIQLLALADHSLAQKVQKFILENPAEINGAVDLINKFLKEVEK